MLSINRLTTSSICFSINIQIIYLNYLVVTQIFVYICNMKLIQLPKYNNNNLKY